MDEMGLKMTDFYNGKRVLVTGHTGFKGTWLCRMLMNAGANVTGYSRFSEKEQSLFQKLGPDARMTHIKGDVRDFMHLHEVFDAVQPEIVFHLAAQPIVRESYLDPLSTYQTNVMGTVNLMECIRLCPTVRSAVNVTTDKVYLNEEREAGFTEEDKLDGYDPYSNSKSCSELVTHSYVKSFFSSGTVAVSTARAGNVIGGGDYAKDRIIPDCIRAVTKGEVIGVRNPASVRPYQHVLEPLYAYLMIAQRQYEDCSYAGSYNVGPDESDAVTTAELVDLFCKYWGNGASWESRTQKNAPHEAGYLKLDCSKLKQTFGWSPRWNIEKAIEMTCLFAKAEDIGTEMDREIKLFLEA